MWSHTAWLWTILCRTTPTDCGQYYVEPHRLTVDNIVWSHTAWRSGRTVTVGMRMEICWPHPNKLLLSGHWFWRNSKNAQFHQGRVSHRYVPAADPNRADTNLLTPSRKERLSQWVDFCVWKLCLREIFTKKFIKEFRKNSTNGLVAWYEVVWSPH
jgi:hypothetical protein